MKSDGYFQFFKSVFYTRKRVPRGYQKSLQYFYRNREKIFFEKYLPKITQGGYQKRWFIFVELCRMIFVVLFIKV